MSDSKKHIEAGLLKSKIYIKLKEKAQLEGDSIDSKICATIYDCVKYSYDKAKLIVKYMPEYTLHDSEHLFRVLGLMERIIPYQQLEKLSIPELMLLILSAFFHDLGMSPDEDDVKAWKKQWKSDVPTTNELKEFESFERFQKIQPDRVDEISRLRINGNHPKAELIEQYLISEYIRLNHAQRVKRLLARDWKNLIFYDDTPLTKILADICQSHNEDALSLLNLDPNYLSGEDTNICIPYIAVILRLADLLDFDAKRTPSVLFSHLAVRNAVSLAEWQKHRSIKAWRINATEISFAAECQHPAIESAINKFCDYIDLELKNCSAILTKISEQNPHLEFERYKLNLPLKVNRDRIGPEKDIESGDPIYEYWDTSFNLNKNQVIELLMGTQLYGSKEVALRELIQNSIDACLLSEAMHTSWNAPYYPKIAVKFYSIGADDFLEVSDNGMGMNKDIINNYYSKVGSSFYKSKDFFELKAKANFKFTPISRFGIGILSTFMVAESVEVQTKRLNGKYSYDSSLKLVIEGYDSIFTVLKSDKEEPGTTTVLLLRKDHPWKHYVGEDLIKAIKKAVPNPQVPISIFVEGVEEQKFSKRDFSIRKAAELKGSYWIENHNIREEEIIIDEDGFTGNAIVGIIQQDEEPVEKVDVHSNETDVNGENFTLSLKMLWDINSILRKGDSLEIDDTGKIKSSYRQQTIAKSNALFSIHGISYEGGLFPEYSFNAKKTSLQWPFPILLVLDVHGFNDLDLNSARNEIVLNEKWNLFEQKLAKLICKKLANNLDTGYCEKLFALFHLNCKSENFKIALEEIINDLSMNGNPTFIIS